MFITNSVLTDWNEKKSTQLLDTINSDGRGEIGILTSWTDHQSISGASFSSVSTLFSNAFYLDLVCILCYDHKVVDTRLVVRQLFNCLCDNFSASSIGCILSLNFHLFGDSSIYLERLVWTGGALRIHWQSCCLILGASITGSSNSYQYGKDWVFLKFEFKMQKVSNHYKNWSVSVVCVGHSKFMSYPLCSQVPQPEREPV